MPGPREYGDGILHRVTKQIYWFLALTVCFIAAVILPFTATLFLERDASNLPVFALLLWLCAPAVSAAFFTSWRRTQDLDEGPFAAFGEGLKRNWKGALVLALPVAVIGGLTSFNFAYGGVAGVPAGFMWASAGVTVLGLVWLLHALLIHSQYEFRLRDIAKLGAFYVTAKPLVSLGVISLLVLCTGIVYFTFDAVLVLFGGVISYLFWNNEKPVLENVREQFVAQ